MILLFFAFFGFVEFLSAEYVPVDPVTEVQKSYFLSSINRNRALVANGQMVFEYNEKGENQPVQFGSAADMMEVRWSDNAATYAEKAVNSYCLYNTFPAPPHGYEYSAYSYSDANLGFQVSPDLAAQRYFAFSKKAFPTLLTMAYRKSKDYLTEFSWERIEVLSTKAELFEIGCAIAQCNGATNVVCYHGQYILRSCEEQSCSLYRKGPTCSRCAIGTRCNNSGLCKPLFGH